MFDRLEDLLIRLEEIMSELSEPSVVNDTARFQKLMKEQSELTPIVDAYKEYKKCKETVEESLMMLEEETDEEMKELLKEELSDAKKRIPELENELKILLLPKDPNDDKNVIVEIRAGAGGDEAALFGRGLPDVCEICREPPLENRDDVSQREWHRRFQGSHFHDYRPGRLFPAEI